LASIVGNPLGVRGFGFWPYTAFRQRRIVAQAYREAKNGH
jgi:hypothetical protein